MITSKVKVLLSLIPRGTGNLLALSAEASEGTKHIVDQTDSIHSVRVSSRLALLLRGITVKTKYISMSKQLLILSSMFSKKRMELQYHLDTGTCLIRNDFTQEELPQIELIVVRENFVIRAKPKKKSIFSTLMKSICE